MKNIIFKAIFKKGKKGDKGDGGISYELPTNAIIKYDGETVPEGFIETSTPSGGGATIVSKTITANGTYNASSDNADGYDPLIVNVASAPVINPVYDWFATPTRDVVVRRKISDGTFRIYWNNYNYSSWSITLPPPLIEFVNKMYALAESTLVQCHDWQTPAGYNYINIGFYRSTMRAWTPNLATNLTPTGVNCIMESTDAGDTGTIYHPYTAPTFDPYNG